MYVNLSVILLAIVVCCNWKLLYLCRYIEIFRSTHAEITPVRGAMGARGTPYDRPGRGGTFGRGYVGFGAKYGTGYERQYRGRGKADV